MNGRSFVDTNVLVYAHDTGLPAKNRVGSAARRGTRFRLSFWDAMIVRAALAAGAETLLSEDLSHGQSYGAVRVVNPFLA